MQKITFTIIPSDTDEAQQFITHWAAAEDRGQAATRRNEVVRHNFLLGRALLRALLHHTTHRKDWILHADSCGKLYTTRDTGMEGPAISISHTRGCLACAVSQDGLIGIDIERWRARDYTGIATYAFGPTERKAVAREGAAAFYRIWTLREAIAKATGDGVMAMMDGKDCVRDGTWQFFTDLPEPHCNLAIAIKDAKESSFVRIDIATLL